MSDPRLSVPAPQQAPVNDMFIERTVPPSIGEVFGANIGSYVEAPITQTLIEARGLPERDIGFDVLEYLNDKGIDPKSADGKRISMYGLNKELADIQYQQIQNDIRRQEIFETAGFATSMIGDPVLVAELLATGGTAFLLRRLLMKGGKEAFEANMRANVDRFLSPDELKMSRVNAQAVVMEKMAKKGFRIANAEAGFFEGTATMLNLMNDLSRNDPADQAVIDAFRQQLTAQGIASVVGLGLGRIADNRLSPPQIESVSNSYNTSIRNLKEMSEGISAKPKIENIPVTTADPMPDVGVEELFMTAEWFTESIFYRALPTPVKAVMGRNSKATKEVRLRFMRLINDAGVMFKLNQLGKGFGRSVHQEAGELAGKWGGVYNDIYEIWGEASSSGNYTIADMQISNTIENIQKIRGKESLTFEDFGQHVVDLYINNKKPRTDAESRAVEALRGYFGEWEKMLNEVGLLGARNSMIAKADKISDRMSGLDNVVDDILKSNTNFLETQITKLDGFIDNMNKTQVARGLTDKQIAKRNELIKAKSDLATALERSYNITSIEDALRQLDELRLSVKQKDAINNINNARQKMLDQLNSIDSYLNDKGMYPNLKENFFPRYFNRQMIEANKQEFIEVLTREYQANPFVYQYNKKTKLVEKINLDLVTGKSARDRAIDTTNEILETVDDNTLLDELTYFGAGKSKHLLHRKLDIPNSKLQKFIVTDLKQVLIAYNEKVAPKYAFARQFRKGEAPATIDDILEQNTREMRDQGVSQKEINRINKEFVGAYDRIVGRVLTKPDTISSRVAQWLTTAAQWTYLGGAGMAAVADFANVFMDHEMKTIMRGLTSLADDNSIKMAKTEMQKAGDGFEVIGGTYQMKFMESLTSDPMRSGLTDRINTGFYKFNLLSQITMLAKTFDSMFRGHTVIELSQRLAKGEKLSDFDAAFLARYNIDKDMAARIASMPVEYTKNKFVLPNTDAWTDEGALTAFRSAVRSGTMNRIIMGTPADKPLMMSGKTYIPMHLAKELGMKESKRVKGYAEVENAMLAVPFTFYTYTVGALNKVTTNYAQGAVRNPAIHTAIAMFFGYQIVKARTPSFAWNEMDAEDKVLRAFDFSGLAALYSDMFYRTLEMGMAFDVTNPTPFSPKFIDDPDKIGGVVSLFGAPADYAYGFVKSGQEFARGEYGDGTETFARQIPLIWNMFIKDYTNALKNQLGDFARIYED